MQPGQASGTTKIAPAAACDSDPWNCDAALQDEVLRDYGLEWDRVLFTTLGVANQRLYELRLQTAQVGQG